MYFRRIPIDDVPEGEEACAAWLHKLFQEKVGNDKIVGEIFDHFIVSLKALIVCQNI